MSSANPQVQHITQADMQRAEVATFAPVLDRVDEAALTVSWASVQLPHVIDQPAIRLAAQSGAGKAYRVTTWFRIKLDTLQDSAGPNSLYLIRWLAAGQIAVYADGRLLYRSTGTPVWNLFSHPSLLLPLNRTADALPPKTVLIRMDSLSEPAAGISSLYVGDAAMLASKSETRDWLANQLPFMCSAAFLAIGLFSLALWLRKPSTPYLLIFVIALSSAIRRWHFQLGAEKLPIADDWFIWLTLNALMWHNIATHYFLQFLHGRAMRWTSRSMLMLAVVFFVATLPMFKAFPSMLALRPYAHVVLISMAVLVWLLGLWHAWRSPSVDAKLVSVSLMVAWCFGVYDWSRLRYVNDLESYYLSPYAAMLLFVVFTAIIFRRYLAAQNEVAQVNASLAQRLQTREAELATSYERLRHIEHDQTVSHERQRLMRDMHDGLGSSLISAIRSVERGGMSDTQVSQILKDCMDDLKLAIDSMEPVDADLLLLLATLRFRLEPRLEGTGITLLWKVQELPTLDWLEPSSALHILRIVQEAFANILRHTKATEIAVSTGVADDGVTVTITDNGPGFDADTALLSGGKGLQNQLRRAQFLGGRVSWQSAQIGSGASMTLWLPMKRG